MSYQELLQRHGQNIAKQDRYQDECRKLMTALIDNLGKTLGCPAEAMKRLKPDASQLPDSARAYLYGWFDREGFLHGKFALTIDVLETEHELRLGREAHRWIAYLDKSPKAYEIDPTRIDTSALAVHLTRKLHEVIDIATFAARWQ